MGNPTLVLKHAGYIQFMNALGLRLRQVSQTSIEGSRLERMRDQLTLHHTVKQSPLRYIDCIFVAYATLSHFL